MASAGTEPTESRTRRTTYIVVALILAIAMGVGAFALISLVGPWFNLGNRGVHRVHDLGWGAVGGVVITVGLLAQIRPERAIAPLQGVLASLAALLVASLVSAEVNAFAAIPVVAGAILIGLHPTRGDVLKPGPRVSVPLAVLAVAAAIPLIVYGLDQAAIQRACPPAGDAHCDEFHWSSMAGMAFAFPLAGLAAALGAPGWRLLAWLTGLAAGVFGLASVVFPNLPSSVGRTWGFVAIGTGVLFIALAEWRARRDASHAAGP